jgi:hypothetical protein
MFSRLFWNRKKYYIGKENRRKDVPKIQLLGIQNNNSKCKTRLGDLDEVADFEAYESFTHSWS